MDGFRYPGQPYVRRHGPHGYSDYESYRDWLRDEFLFRCVYCLHREQWHRRSAMFHIDHFIPVAADESKQCEYENLLYACASCNEYKKAITGIPNPCDSPYGELLRIRSDGVVEPLNEIGVKLERALRLNSPDILGYRSRMIRILHSLKVTDIELYNELMGFPIDLPDLRKKRVSNTKPEGALQCWYVMREKSQLPETY
jgi:hypothetical protein